MVRRVAVIGAGIVGLSCAHRLRQNGFAVTVFARDPIGEGASGVNAGGVAVPEILPQANPRIFKQVPGWLADPLGPLHIRAAQAPRLLPWMWRFLKAGMPNRRAAITQAFARLMAPVLDDHKSLVKTLALRDWFRTAGCIYVYGSEAARAAEAEDWAARRRAGITVESLEREDLVALEPDLGPAAHCGYLAPGWAFYTDPRHLLRALADLLESQGVAIQPEEVMEVEIADGRPQRLRLVRGRREAFDLLVVAAGAWSGKFAAQLGDPFPLQSQRGYNTTLPEPGVRLGHAMMFAEEHFAATPMVMGLRIGGAVEFGGLNAQPNFKRAEALLTLARRYFPDLRTEGGIQGQGHRPSTPDEIPVIGRATRFDNVLFAFGHGHLGLTLGPTTGRLIAELAAGQPSMDLSPFRIDRF